MTQKSFFLAVMLAVLLALAPRQADGQTPSATAPGAVDAAAERSGSAPQPFLERKVGSTLERFTQWKARMKKEHLTAYLVAYTFLLGTAVGAAYGFLAFRFGDAMGLYRDARKKTFLISLACGLSVGVLAALGEIPHAIAGKLTMLLMAMLIGVFSTSLMTMLVFLIQRKLMEKRAKRTGSPVTSRLRAP